jgi:hypothetical protein
MAVLWVFRTPSLCRHVHRELWRSVLLDLTPIIAATACHPRNDVERYRRYKPTVCSSNFPLVYCHINSLQRASNAERPLPGGEKRRGGRASPHEALCSDEVVSPPACATGLSLRAVWYLSGATPQGQPWTPAMTLSQGRDGLSAWWIAVLSTLRAPSVGHHVHRELRRSAWLDVTPIISATACHLRNYIER